MEPKEKKAFEPSGLVPRSIVRTFERFRQQLLPGSETAAIREYRISRYQVLVSVRCLFTLLIIPIATNWLVSSWLLSPLVEHFWNTQQNEIFLNSYQEERAFAELESFSEKLFFESLLNTTNIIHVNDTSVAASPWDVRTEGYISSSSIPTKMNSSTKISYALPRPSERACAADFSRVVSPSLLGIATFPPLGDELRSANDSVILRGKEGLPSCALEDHVGIASVVAAPLAKFVPQRMTDYPYGAQFSQVHFSGHQTSAVAVLAQRERGLLCEAKGVKDSRFDMNDLIINSERNRLARRDRSIINTFLGKDSLLAVPQRGMHERMTIPLNDMTTSSSNASAVSASPSHAARRSHLRFPRAFAKENPARVAELSFSEGKRSFEVRTLLHKASASNIEDVKALSTKINQLRMPTLVEGYCSDAPLLTGIKAKTWGTEVKAPSLLNDYVILESTYDNSLKIKEKVQNKILELAIYYNQQTIISITNIVGDVVSLVTLGCLFIWMKPEITILKSFLIEAIYSLSDTTKSFLLILLTDLLVGFHSPRGWETALELLLKHFGLPENQDFVFLFVATFPVLLDTVFKYWIFRHLNKISPSTVATYHSMIE